MSSSPHPNDIGPTVVGRNDAIDASRAIALDEGNIGANGRDTGPRPESEHIGGAEGMAPASKRRATEAGGRGIVAEGTTSAEGAERDATVGQAPVAASDTLRRGREEGVHVIDVSVARPTARGGSELVEGEQGASAPGATTAGTTPSGGDEQRRDAAACGGGALATGGRADAGGGAGSARASAAELVAKWRRDETGSVPSKEVKEKLVASPQYLMLYVAFDIVSAKEAFKKEGLSVETRGLLEDLRYIHKRVRGREGEVVSPAAERRIKALERGASVMGDRFVVTMSRADGGVDTEEARRWAAAVAGLHASVGVDVVAHVSHCEEFRAAAVRWRPEMDRETHKPAEPALRKDWLCATFARMARMGVDTPRVEVSEGCVWAVGRIIDVDGDVDWESLEGIEVRSALPPAQLLRVGPVPAGLTGGVIPQVELLVQEAGWKVVGDSLRTVNSDAFATFIEGRIRGATPGWKHRLCFIGPGGDLEAEVEVLPGRGRRSAEPGTVRGKVADTRAPRVAGSGTDVAIRGAEAAQQADDAPGAAAAAPETALPGVSDGAQAAAGAGPGAPLRRSPARPSDGYCAADAIAREITRLRPRAPVTCGEVQRCVKGHDGPATWDAKDVVSAAAKLKVGICVVHGTKVYGVGTGRKDARVMVFVDGAGRHMRACTEGERRRVLVAGDGPGLSPKFKFEQLRLQLRGLPSRKRARGSDHARAAGGVSRELDYSDEPDAPWRGARAMAAPAAAEEDAAGAAGGAAAVDGAEDARAAVIDDSSASSDGGGVVRDDRDCDGMATLLKEFERWLDGATAAKVEALLNLRTPMRARFKVRQTPRWRLVAGVFRAITRAALGESVRGKAQEEETGDRREAAEILFVAFPKLFLGAEGTPAERVRAVIDGRKWGTPEAKAPLNGMERLAMSLAGRCEDQHLTGIMRTLDGGPTVPFEGTADQVGEVAARLFQRHLEGEVPREDRFARDLRLRREEGGDAAVRVTVGAVRAWAFRKAEKAADLYGWSGKVVTALAKADRSALSAIARAINRPPGLWACGSAAAAIWREVKGSLIPKAGRPGDMRPIGTTSVFRRIWTAAATALLWKQADAYCRKRGQLGLGGGAATYLYAALARGTLHRGGTVLTDDRANSYGNVHRRTILEAAADFVAAVPLPERATCTVVMGALLHRVFIDPEGPLPEDAPVRWNARTVHVYPRIGAQHVNHALVQGSPESGLLEALVYAFLAPPTAAAEAAADPGSVRRVMFHDDGHTTAPRGASVAALQRPAPRGGAPYAEAKARVRGPLAEEAVTHGLASQQADVGFVVIGIPIGPAPEHWVRLAFMDKVLGRIATLRRIFATPGKKHLSAVGANLSGGPAAMGRHWMRATPPSPAITQILQEADSAWLFLWCTLCDVDPVDATAVRRVKRRLYGPRPSGLGHQQAADVHALAFAEASLEAVDATIQIVAQHDGAHTETDMVPTAAVQEVWSTLAIGPAAQASFLAQDRAAEAVTVGELRAQVKAILRATRDAEVAKWQASCAARAREILTDPHGSSCGDAAVLQDGFVSCNLLLEALDHPVRVHEGDSEIDDRKAGILLRRIFGLPFVHPADHRDNVAQSLARRAGFPAAPRDPLTVPPGPPLCALCGVPASLFGSPEGDLSANLAPQKTLDDRMEHAITCRGNHRHAIRKHDLFARVVAGVARDGGMVAHTHPTALARTGATRHTLRRPGDVVACRRDGGGVVAIDVTIRTGGQHAVAMAEKAKIAYYAGVLENSPVEFYPFAVSTRGQLGRKAADCMRFLAEGISMETGMSKTGAERFMRARLANGFAVGMSTAIEEYLVASKEAGMFMRR